MAQAFSKGLDCRFASDVLQVIVRFGQHWPCEGQYTYLSFLLVSTGRKLMGGESTGRRLLDISVQGTSSFTLSVSHLDL